MTWAPTSTDWGELAMAEGSQSGSFSLPAGTVTFLLSDVEGSTRLWAQAPDAAAQAVAAMYAILDAAITRHGGVRPVEQGEGDSVVGAFSRASDAVAAALRAQLELQVHRWPDDIEFKVRIALHTADAQLRDDGNYFGLALSRCARLRSIARGGQTLLSRATRDLVVDRLPADVDLVDCGLHRLRDLGRPENVFVLVHPELEGDSGVLRSLDAFPNNLPDQLTSFVGRARELSELREALTETRLLTLTGAGGAGKTRLALQVAADALEQFPDGAWWVDLAPLSDPEVVGDAFAAALGVRPFPGMTALQASCAHLVSARALVVLDNCEHVLAASAEVAEALMHACTDVVVIATSRAPLGIGGESDWRVPSLSLPSAQRPPEALAVLRQSDAVRLFIERARKARPNFAVTNDTAPAVAQICHELDGLPLAIELAAARVRMLSVGQIAAGLGDRFHLLTGGTRTALPRQQTLRASVDWSHELLSDPERVLLRRLSVFAGGFTLDLAEAVSPGDGIEPIAILDLLASLVDKSLVVVDERVAAVRYRLLETVRQYSLERLAEAGEADTVRDRHRDAMVSLAERIAPELHGPAQREWLEVLDQEAANLGAALERAIESSGEQALRLCVALTFWWKLRGLFVPAERSFARALDVAADETPTLLGQAMWGRGFLAAYSGRPEAAMAALTEATTIAQETGDRRTLARALVMIGWLQMFADPPGSRETSLQARELAGAINDEWAWLSASMNLVWTYLFQTEFDAAESVLAETLPTSERFGYLELRARHWLGMCWRPWTGGDLDLVADRATRALELALAAGEPSTEALAHCFLALTELQRGDAQAAADRLGPTRSRMVAAGAGLALGYTEYYLASALAALGALDESRELLERQAAAGLDQGYMLANCLVNLADVLRIAGEPDLAEGRAAGALEIAEKIGSPLMTAAAKEILGRVAGAHEDWARAEGLLHEALSVRMEYELVAFVPPALDALAQVAAGLESYEETARTLGAAQGGRDRMGMARWAPDDARCREVADLARQALGAERYAEAFEEGRDLSPEDAVSWIRRARGERKRPSRGWESLTPTELRVVELVAEGLTNPQIAERMFISRGTVKVHLSHIFAKVGAGTRAELAAESTRRLMRDRV